MFVQLFKGQENLRRVEFSTSLNQELLFLAQFVFGCQKAEKLSSRAVLKEKVELSLIVKACFKLH